jgi:hypothetical protein
MNVTFPPVLADALARRAQQRQVPAEDLVREAVAWYLGLDESLLDELRAWQEVRDEALDRVDRHA